MAWPVRPRRVSSSAGSGSAESRAPHVASLHGTPVRNWTAAPQRQSSTSGEACRLSPEFGELCADLPGSAVRSVRCGTPFPRHLRPPYSPRWPNLPTSRRSRKILPSRRAPRRRASTCRRSRRRWPKLLNPGIAQGTAGVGSQTGLQASRRRQFVRPPRRLRRRAQGARTRRRRASARRRRPAMSRRRRSGRWIRTSPEPSGIEDEDRARQQPPGSPRTRRGAGTDRARGGHPSKDRRSQSRPPPARHHREPGSARPAAARGPAGIRRAAVDAAPAAAAGEIRRRPPARHQVRLRARRATSRRRSRSWSRASAPRPHPGAARRHRLGQDLHHGEGDRGDAAPGADPRAQQDARRRSSTASSSRFFPDNAVEYFVSYYDYYQPEAYVPRTDTYIEKESSINEQIDRMRHSATRALLERDDVIIVASVSCIYGIGSVETYSAMTFTLKQRRAHRPAPAASPTSSRCNTSAPPATSSAARSACAATRSTFSRRTTRTAPGG